MDDETQGGSQPAEAAQQAPGEQDAAAHEPDDQEPDAQEAGDQEPGALLSRLEHALDRIDRGARPVGSAEEGGPAEAFGRLPASDIAYRLDALIAQLRSVLADRPGRD